MVDSTVTNDNTIQMRLSDFMHNLGSKSVQFRDRKGLNIVLELI